MAIFYISEKISNHKSMIWEQIGPTRIVVKQNYFFERINVCFGTKYEKLTHVVMVCAKWDLMFQKTYVPEKEIITMQDNGHDYISQVPD